MELTLFAQNEKALYMIDQHAAQERIKYEQFGVEMGRRWVVSHMVPILLEFSKDKGEAGERLSLVEEFGTRWNRLSKIRSKFTHPAY